MGDLVLGPASCLDAFSSKKLLIFLDPVSKHQQLFVWISRFPGKTVFSGTQFKVVTDNSFISAFENTAINLNRNVVSLTSDKKTVACSVQLAREEPPGRHSQTIGVPRLRIC